MNSKLWTMTEVDLGETAFVIEIKEKEAEGLLQTTEKPVKVRVAGLDLVRLFLMLNFRIQL